MIRIVEHVTEPTGEATIVQRDVTFEGIYHKDPETGDVQIEIEEPVGPMILFLDTSAYPGYFVEGVFQKEES